MDPLEDDSFEDLPDSQMPVEVVDLTMLDDDSLFVEQRLSTEPGQARVKPESDQAQVKPEPDTDEQLNHHIKAEAGPDDRSPRELSTGTFQDQNTREDPFVISDVEDDTQDSQTNRESQPGHIKFQSGPDATSPKATEQPDNTHDTVALEFLKEDLRVYTMRRNILQARSGGAREELQSDTIPDETPSSPSKTYHSLPRTAKEWWEKRYESKKDQIARERNRLYHTPLPANTRSRKRRRVAKPVNKRLFGNQTKDQMFEARAALQDLPEAGEVSATTKEQQLKQTIADAAQHGDEQTLKDDGKQLEQASRSFGLNNCKPDNRNWASAKFIVKGLKTRLLAHQVINVSRMLGREFGEDRGGINADEMGLGKTIQAFGCIAHNQPGPTDPKTTLIVAPSSVISQWISEIEKHLHTGTHFTYTQFKKKKGENQDNLSNNAIILVSYQELLGSYLPKAVQGEIESLECTPERRQELLDEHLGVFFKMDFWRVVLDEAHAIKNHLSQTSIVCRKVKAKHRWALTGTPIQNTPEVMFQSAVSGDGLSHVNLDRDLAVSHVPARSVGEFLEGLQKDAR
ncbi:SNF2 superfamily protein [Apiospora hydei]|uniref:SNF2 superfamily protein n=1 Tax=Apiospora hydei TaxID=1337664 RepID=A0ABR1W833_9PEZI